jgi:SAM-dependent methyltransferase
MDESLYKTFAAVERTHWWFVARRRIVEDQIGRVMGLKPGAAILDAGCGTGGVLEALRETYIVSGMDISPTAVQLCHDAGLTGVRQGTFDADPFPGGSYDCVLLLDVIEHIQDDVAALAAARAKLAPGGRVLVTVPAYQFLWSAHDDLNHHQRRYHRALLRQRMEQAGLVVDRITYFNTVLFPAALLQRVVAKVMHTNSDDSLRVPSAVINRIFTAMFSMERPILRSISLPYGLSLLAIARSA